MESRSTFGEPLTGNSREFRRMLGYSALFHGGVLLILIIISFSWTSRPLASPVYEVDLVSLPEAKPVAKKKPPVKKVETPKPPPPKKKSVPKPKPIPAPKPVPPLAVVKPAPQPAKPEPRPEPVVPDVQPPDVSPSVEEALEEATSDAPIDPLAAIPAPDVQIQAQVEIPDFEYPYYLELIRRKIGRHWAPPRLNTENDIQEAVVEFQLFSKGNMTGIRISKSSGNAFFDQAALRAIYQANPLPPLPQGVEKETLKIKLQFVLGRKG